jgi:hypothetical protein
VAFEYNSLTEEQIELFDFRLEEQLRSDPSHTNSKEDAYKHLLDIIQTNLFKFSFNRAAIQLNSSLYHIKKFYKDKEDVP